MRRREFISLVGSAVVASPLSARAQQPPAMPVVGYLTSLGRDDRPNLAEAARRGLSEAGFVDGRNVTINTVLQKTKLIDCRHLRPTSSTARRP